MKVSLEVKGFKDVEGALKDLEKRIPRLTAAEVKSTAITTERLAKKNLIANKSVVTGTLLRSITTEQMNDWMEAEVGTVVVYAPYVEFGHRGRRTIGGEEVGGFLVRGKPYLGPAFEAAVLSLEARLKERLSK
jgi:phage gpG-like protein